MTGDFSDAAGEELVRVKEQIAMLEQRQRTLENLIAGYKCKVPLSEAEEAGLSTMEMARRVLADRGTEMGAAEIRREIRRKFEVNAAPSLQQMLYLRSVKGTQVYREGGKYGLPRLALTSRQIVSWTYL